jgi:hypothetical protein
MRGTGICGLVSFGKYRVSHSGSFNSLLNNPEQDLDDDSNRGAAQARSVNDRMDSR